MINVDLTKSHPKSWYKIGRIVKVSDKMQHATYRLTAPYGKRFAKDFKPALSPQRMLSLGVFEGKYMNDCYKEFPKEWYVKAIKKGKLSKKADPSINFFKIKSRLSLQEWRRRKWVPIKVDGYKDIDIRGWFQWYCRYYIGRRCPTDQIQINRWKRYIRHYAQVVISLKKTRKKLKTLKDLLNHRPKQRQSLLQWAYDPFVGFTQKN